MAPGGGEQAHGEREGAGFRRRALPLARAARRARRASGRRERVHQARHGVEEGFREGVVGRAALVCPPAQHGAHESLGGRGVGGAAGQSEQEERVGGDGVDAWPGVVEVDLQHAGVGGAAEVQHVVQHSVDEVQAAAGAVVAAGVAGDVELAEFVQHRERGGGGVEVRREAGGQDVRVGGEVHGQAGVGVSRCRRRRRREAPA